MSYHINIENLFARGLEYFAVQDKISTPTTNSETAVLADDDYSYIPIISQHTNSETKAKSLILVEIADIEPCDRLEYLWKAVINTHIYTYIPDDIDDVEHAKNIHFTRSMWLENLLGAFNQRSIDFKNLINDSGDFADKIKEKRYVELQKMSFADLAFDTIGLSRTYNLQTNITYKILTLL